MLDWLPNFGPDLCVEISQIASVTKKKYNENPSKYIKRLNEAITYALKYPTQLCYPKLNACAVRLIDYSNAALANNEDLTSQLGRILFLMDTDENASPIAFKSYKSRRVTRSVVAAEVIAFSDLFYEVCGLKDTIEISTAKSVQLHLFAASKRLVDVTIRVSKTNEKGSC